MKYLLILLFSSLAFGQAYVNKQPFDLTNISLTGSVGSSALNINLKTKNGPDASTGNPIYIGFRNNTSTAGTNTQLKVTGYLGLTVPSTATLGQISAVKETTQILLQNNASTAQLCVTTAGFFDDGSVQTSVTISAAATSRTALYCASGATGAVRNIGRLISTQATAGTWSTAPTEVTGMPFLSESVNAASNQKQVTMWIAFAEGGTNCTSSPCTINDQSGGFDSVTRTGTGVYRLDITPGMCASDVACSVTGNEPEHRTTLASSTTSFNYSSRDSNGTAADDTNVYAICHCRR